MTNTPTTDNALLEALLDITPAQRDIVLAYYIHNVGAYDVPAQVKEALENYQGTYSSMAAFAKEYHTNTGTDLGPLKNHIDWYSVATEMEQDYFITDSGYVFLNV